MATLLELNECLAIASMYNVLLYHALEIDTFASMFDKYLYV